MCESKMCDIKSIIYLTIYIIKNSFVNIKKTYHIVLTWSFYTVPLMPT